MIKIGTSIHRIVLNVHVDEMNYMIRIEKSIHRIVC